MPKLYAIQAIRNGEIVLLGWTEILATFRAIYVTEKATPSSSPHESGSNGKSEVGSRFQLPKQYVA